MLQAVGIDLGTSKAVVAALRRGEPLALFSRERSPIVPALVARGPKGRLLVGHAARAHADEGIQATTLAHGAASAPAGLPYTRVELMALFLARLKQEAEHALGEPVRRAVLAIPVYFGQGQMAALDEAARLAGLFPLRLVRSPIAAVLAYSAGRPGVSPQTVLVFDLGGGCLDVAVVHLLHGAVAPLSVAGEGWLGGDELTDAVVAHLIRQLQGRRELLLDETQAARRRLRRVLRRYAEQAKVALSVVERASVFVPGEALGLPRELGEALTRAEFEGMIRPRLDDAVAVAERAIEASGLPPEGIDGILLAGGSSQVPLLEALLAERFPRARLLRGLNPLLGVAQGAAILAGTLDRVECPNCGHAAPPDREACPRCHSALAGEERVLCHDCHLPNDARRPACWKCGASLRPALCGATAEPLRCLRCGAAVQRGAASCPACQRPLAEADPWGLRCRGCGAALAPGAPSCPSCAALVTPFVGAISAHSLGIEFPDGQLDVLLGAGQALPSPRPACRSFRTSAPGQRELRLRIYEGERQAARENPGGRLRLDLPEGLPAGSQVRAVFALDRDGRLQVSASLGDGLPGEVDAAIEWLN